MEGDVALLATLAGIAFLAGFIHSAIGFGFGIVAISLMPFVIDARSAHVIVSVSSVPMLIMAAWAYREGIDWRTLKQALLGAALFLPLGFVLFEMLPLDWLVRGTGLAILVMVLSSLRNSPKAENSRPRRGACFLAGAASGFLAGAVSIAGPPVAAFALSQSWDQTRYKAFVTQSLLVIAFYKAALLVFRGHMTISEIGSTSVVAVLSIIGVQLGVLASKRIAPVRFKRLVAVTLLLVACILILRGQPSGAVDRGSEGTELSSPTVEKIRLGEMTELSLRPSRCGFSGRQTNGDGTMVRTDIGSNLVSPTFQTGITQTVVEHEPKREAVIPIPCRLDAESIDDSHQPRQILKVCKPG